jgi:hypothetical protein
MPQAKGGVVLSVTGGEPRRPFSQHAFAGGNVFMLEVLKTFGEELAVTASSDHFNIALGRARAQLANRTAAVILEDAAASGETLRVEVLVASQVGHKFPSGFPSRRVWLHVTVRDASDQVVFESGAFSPEGSIVGNDNDADPAAYEPHYLAITDPDQVQIYEPIMGDAEGGVTTTLLLAASYLKDNRLLPAGFDRDGADDDIALYGRVRDDGDFVGGSDVTVYEVDLGDAQGPYTVTAELLYQSIGYRWAQNLGQHEAAEIDTFLGYYEAVPNLPVVVARDAVEVVQ